MTYAEPASQRELTDGRARRASRRQSANNDSGPELMMPLPLGTRIPVFIGIDYSKEFLDEQALARVAGLLKDDPVAATMVAATINTRQSAQESGGAFVKRIVRSWLEEMGR